MKKTIMIVAAVLLTACQGKMGNQGAMGPQGPAAPVPTETTIQMIVDTENLYREAQGLDPLTQGLACSVQAIASGSYLSSSSPGYTAAQAIVTTGPSYAYLLTTALDQPNTAGSGPNDIIAGGIQPLFETNNYKITCNGQLVVTEDGYHSFNVASDDGAIMWIDGTMVTDNDGSHGVSAVSGTKLLQAAVTHTFQIQYAQSGGGPFALVVQMDGSILPAANLYH